MALLGPNGAGKSTLLKVWVGFERATRGVALSAGLDPWRDRTQVIRRVGYVAQTPALYDELSVEEHIDLAAYLRRGLDRSAALRRTDALGLPRRSRADELSGGQRAQLGLALVLAAGADILLLDEPLASLDPLARREFLRHLMGEARASGATVVLSSHIVTDVADSCDDVIVLSQGRVLLYDTVEHARAGHRVESTEAAPSGALVASFPTESGMSALVHADAGASVPGRTPTLEELVLGYLAAPTVQPPLDQ